MAVPQSVNRASTAQIDLELPLRYANTATAPVTIQKSVPTTNSTMPPLVREPHRSGAISRAGRHRWPQATMVVMGGTECQVYDTEMLTVSTTNKELKMDLKNTKTMDDYLMEVKSVFPDIVENGGYDSRAAEAKQERTTRTRFLKSPTKVGLLPRIQKGTAASESRNFDTKEEDKKKVVCNIKFWRGTTPAAKEVELDKVQDGVRQSNGEESQIANPAKDHTKEPKNTLHNWSEQLSTLEESSKKQFFSWHMALRERLLKHEKTRYHEAVVRISKYRQRLRQRPNMYAAHKDARFVEEVQAWKNILQRHEESKKRAVTTNFPSGVRMSPTKEWKPHILGQKEAETSNKPPFFGKNITAANDSAKMKLNKHNNPVLSSSMSTRHPTTSASKSPNYPVHGEGLLKVQMTEKKQSLPYTDELDSHKDDSKIADKHSSEEKEEVNKEMDDKAETRALLIDLKKQLREPVNTEQPIKSPRRSAKRGSTAPNSNSTALGAKLKLLLQNSAQSQRQQPNDIESTSRKPGPTRQSTRSRMRSEHGKYRPLTRPRTYGEGALPKIHNIATSLWKQSNDEETVKVKHRLTLNGIAKRESFPSGVIAIAKKHISNRSSEDSQEQSRPTNATTKESTSDNQGNQTDTGKLSFAQEQPIVKQLKVGQESNREGSQDKMQQTSKSGSKKHTAAKRLYTPAYIASNKSIRNFHENPQHTCLQLVSSMTSQHQLQEHTKEFEHRENRQTKSRKLPAGKHKVLRIAVVEPPLTAGERQQRQQEKDKSRQRLTFNPTHAAVANFTAAMLNSELALRAPSSSPVDMFFRSLYRNQMGEHTTAELWNMQKADGTLPVKEVNLSKQQRGSSPKQDEYLQINVSDGLRPPQQPSEASLAQLYDLYSKVNIKAATAPKVKDLMDLQRFYRVMKKHGDSYTNGGVGYFYSPSPAHTGATIREAPSKHALHRRHTNQKNLHKQPYYYYPYSNGDPASDPTFADHRHVPLYVVTNANSLTAQRHSEYQDGSASRINLGHSHAHMPDFQHLLNYQEPLESTRMWKKPLEKHEITVRMPKTPGIAVPATVSMSHLEQIQEHVIN